MAVPRRPAPVKEVDLEQTAELPVIDFTGTHAELASTDVTVSVPTLGLEDALSRTDTYAVPSLSGAAALTDNLRDVEERLRRKSERVAALERELDALHAAQRELKATLEARVVHAHAEAEREIKAVQAASEAQVQGLRAEHALALKAAQDLAADSARQLTLLTGTHDEAIGRIASLETRVGQHIATLSSQEKELAQRGRRIDELQAQFNQSSGMARELGQERDSLAERTRALETSLAERGAALEASNTKLATALAQLAQGSTLQLRLQAERDELRDCADRQLEALQSLEGYRGVAEALLTERESEVASRDAELAALRTELLQLAERDQRILRLESDLAAARERVAQQDKRVSSLSTDGRALEQRLAELNAALSSADRSALAQSEALRVAAEHSAEVEKQLAAEREQAARLTAELEKTRTTAASELDAARSAAAGELTEARASAARELEAVRAASEAELVRVRAEAGATQQAQQAQAASDLAAAREARDALAAQLAERDDELRRVDAARAQLAAEITGREHGIAERELAVTELLEDQQEQLLRQKNELLAAQESAQRAEGDLHAAEEQLRHFEAEQRHRDARVEEFARTHESLQSRLDDALRKLGEREEQLRRLEGEAHASNAVLGKLQQSIQRLSREDTGSRPVIQEPPLESMARLLVRVDGGIELAYPVARRTTLGRTPDNDIRLDANFVSRHHAVILGSSKNTIIEDLNSTNGVVVNGRRVTRQSLQHGDLVNIGTAEFRFELRPMGHVGDPA